MRFLYIIGGIVLFLFLVSRIRVGIQVNLAEDFTVDLTIGPLHFRAFRKLEITTRDKLKRKETPKQAKKVSKPKTEKIPKPSMRDILEGIKTLWPPLKKALHRLCHGIRIDPLHVSVTLAGQPNPAQTAEDYGKYSAIIWAGMPVLERIFDLPNPHIHLEPDFSTEDSKLEGEAKVTLRIGTLLAVGVGLSIPALRWYLQFRNGSKQRTLDDQDSQKKQQNAQSEQAA